MSISKYQVFLKTVSCGSFSKAAEAMNFTQSGISHAINSLENELGVKLLSRNRGGVVLTADGRAVLPKIEKLCAAHHSLMQTVEGLKDMDSGLVKIATFSSVSAQWLPRILKSFGKVYPNIEFEVVTGDFYDQIEGWIVSGAVDCGFLRLPSVKRLQTYALHRDELQVIVPCDHPYADRDPFPVSALAEEPFIQLEEGDDYEIMAAFDEMGIRPNVKYIAREDRPSSPWCRRGWASACCRSSWCATAPRPSRSVMRPCTSTAPSASVSRTRRHFPTPPVCSWTMYGRGWRKTGIHKRSTFAKKA